MVPNRYVVPLTVTVRILPTALAIPVRTGVASEVTSVSTVGIVGAVEDTVTVVS